MASLKVLHEKNYEDRCIGHCCERLTLDWPPEKLLALAKYQRLWDVFQSCDGIETVQKDGKCHFVATNSEGERLMGLHGDDPVWDTEDGGRYLEIEQIADMVIYLGYEPMSSTHAGKDRVEQARYERTMKHYYTCKNLAENGDCKIYETRPVMCANYPYGGSCDYKKCASSSLRNGATPAHSG